MSSATVIRHTKSSFARHGIPEVVVSDNVPEFRAYKQFAMDYNFKHVTSSPYYPQGNGEVERAVGTIKRLLEKEEDPYLALLAYRSTPVQNGYSPAELLMSRKLRASVPTCISRESLKPVVPDYDQLKAQDKNVKDRQKHGHDKRHRVKGTPLKSGDRVWMPDRESEVCIKQEVAPRSFELITSDGVAVRRNQSIVCRLPERPQEEPIPEQPPEETSSGTHEPEHQEPDAADPAATTEPTANEQPQQMVKQQLRTSSRVHKPLDQWELLRDEPQFGLKRGDVVGLIGQSP